MLENAPENEPHLSAQKVCRHEREMWRRCLQFEWSRLGRSTKSTVRGNVVSDSTGATAVDVGGRASPREILPP